MPCSITNDADRSLPGTVELLSVPASSGPVGRCTVTVGTCGYSYTEWVDGGFYPAGTKSPEMLGFYSRFFSVVELNYTWYQMARPESLTRMVEKAPATQRFAAKLTRTMTHEREGDWQEQLRLYRLGITPLLPQLAAVLVQLPPDFERSIANRTYLAKLLDGLHDLPVAVEFRDCSWAVDAVFAELERRRVTLVTVDIPALPELFPPLELVTNPELFYVRFHGRNREGWRSSNMQKKFNYNYSEQELRQWCDRFLAPLAARANRGIIVFNNHVRAQAPKNAGSLLSILADYGSRENRP